MTAFALALLAIALLLFIVGMAAIAVMLKGCFALRRHARLDVNPTQDSTILLKSPLVPAVSMVVAPTSDFASARDHVRALLDQQFGTHEVVLVLEGRSDRERTAWIEEFRLVRSARATAVPLATRGAVRAVYESSDPLPLVVVDKDPPPGGGPADALNTGVNAASSPVIALIDGHAVFDSVLLMGLIHPMLSDPDGTAAVCGIMLPRPADGLAAQFGDLESLRTWLGRCAAFAAWNRLVPVPGASALVRRDAILKAGGFRGGALELFLDLHALRPAPGRIAFAPEAHSHAPTLPSWAALGQRISIDQAQLARVWGKRLWAIGWVLPGLFLARWVRPLLETLAYLAAIAGWFLGWIDLATAGVVLLCTVGTGILVSMSAVVLREISTFQPSDPVHLTRLFFSAIPENLGYRQVRNLWLIAGVFKSPIM